MLVLAVDTTSAFGSIALLDGDSLVEILPLYSPDGFSTVLFDRIREMLDRHAVALASIGCFAAASGPGSFTGVRVGLTAVKALAEATGAKALAVSNLQALASFGSAGRRGVLLDARRGEIYGAVYDAELRLLSPEVCLAFPDWLRSAAGAIDEVIVTDSAPFFPHLPEGTRIIEQRLLAGAVAAIASRRTVAGDPGDPASLDANYVRRSDAEMKWSDDSDARTA